MLPSRTIHKWIGIVVGIILLMWSVTGIILMIPARRAEARMQPLDLSRAVVAPAQALVAVEDSGLQVRSVTLIRIHDRTVYRIDAGRRPLLVDARDGSRVEITPALAEAIARDALGDTAVEMRVDIIRKRDADYSSGGLPVYRVTVGGAEGAVGHVSMQDGTFIPSGGRSRLRLLAHQMHDFSVIKEWVTTEWFYRTLAIIAASLALVSIFTGYWLTIPPRKRKPRRTEPMAIKVTSDE
jgi:PepSY-associated TM region